MVHAPTLNDVFEHAGKYPNALLCLLFAPPFTRIGANDVIPRIGYLNERSGKTVHFYCAGYGRYWNRSDVPDMKEIGLIYRDGNEIPWAFSQNLFAQFVDSLETKATWKYSGQADLLVLGPNASFHDCLTFDIEKALQDNAIDHANQLFESIIQYSRKVADNSAYDFSDRTGFALLGQAAAAGILSYLPKPLQALWKKGQHYAVRDLANPGAAK